MIVNPTLLSNLLGSTYVRVFRAGSETEQGTRPAPAIKRQPRARARARLQAAARLADQRTQHERNNVIVVRSKLESGVLCLRRNNLGYS